MVKNNLLPGFIVGLEDERSTNNLFLLTVFFITSLITYNNIDYLIPAGSIQEK